MSTLRRLLLTLALLWMASIAGCGGGGGDATATDSPSSGGNTPSPTPVTATATVSLAWSVPSDSRVVGYRVYYGTSSQSYLQSYGAGLDAGGSPSLAIQNLQAGTRYYFAVTSYDASSNESSYSAEVSKVVD